LLGEYGKGGDQALMTTKALSNAAEIRKFAKLLWSPKYTQAFGHPDYDYDSIEVSGSAYEILRPFITARSFGKMEAQIPVRAILGALNPITAVAKMVTDVGKYLIGDLIDPPSETTKACRCIASYYRWVENDDGQKMLAVWGPYQHHG
jgi:hypothetical protein